MEFFGSTLARKAIKATFLCKASFDVKRELRELFILKICDHSRYNISDGFLALNQAASKSAVITFTSDQEVIHYIATVRYKN